MVKIITDSNCDLSMPEAGELGIDMLPVTITIGDKEYRDKIDITNEEFYSKLESGGELPKTALVNSGAFLDAYEKYPDYDIVVLTLSSKLSGTYQAAVMAAGMCHRKGIYVVDTLQVTAGQQLLVRQAVKLANEGKSGDEISNCISALVPRVRISAAIATLKYLVKGGRLSGVSGAVGTVLGVKPIIAIDDGIVQTCGKARGMKNAIDMLVTDIKQTHKIDASMPYISLHSNNPEAADEFAQALSLDPKFKCCIGSSVATHAGPGAVGLAYFRK